MINDKYNEFKINKSFIEIFKFTYFSKCYHIKVKKNNFMQYFR